MSPRSRRYASVGRFNFSSLSVYDRFWNPFINFVALICTFSIILMYFLRCGDQMTWPYSKWGLTNATKIFTKVSGSRWVKLRLMIPTRLFALLTFSVICSANVSSESTMTPRSFSSNVCSISWPLTWYRWQYLIFSSLPRERRWHLSGWNFRSHLSDHASSNDL